MLVFRYFYFLQLFGILALALNEAYNSCKETSEVTPNDAFIYSGFCFQIYRLTKNFNNAKSSCISNGGFLAVVTTQDLLTMIYSRTTTQHIWVGLEQIPGKAKNYQGWRWLDETGTRKWIAVFNSGGPAKTFRDGTNNLYNNETDQENSGAARKSTSARLIDGNHASLYHYICEYVSKFARLHFYQYKQTGRITSVAQTVNVPTNVDCALKCRESPTCMSFSFANVTGDCKFSILQASKASIAADTDYEVWARDLQYET